MPTPSPARVHDAVVVSNVPVAANLWRMVFRAPRLAASLSSGQFFSIAVPGEPKQTARVPLSFSAIDYDAGTVETVYAVQGPGTRALAAMAPGAETSVLGPGGHGWSIDASTRRCLLVAGGCGITPILSAAVSMGLEGMEYDVVVGARTGTSIWGVDRLMASGADNVIIVTDDGTAGAKGTTVDVVESALPTEKYDLVLTCGPEPMMKGVAELCQKHSVACQISMERMMTCGFGACATCVVPTDHGNVGACMGGPVFNASEVIW